MFLFQPPKLLTQKINAFLYTIAGDNNTYLVHIWKWFGITCGICESYTTLIWVIAPHIKSTNTWWLPLVSKTLSTNKLLYLILSTSGGKKSNTLVSWLWLGLWLWDWADYETCKEARNCVKRTKLWRRVYCSRQVSVNPHPFNKFLKIKHKKFWSAQL